MGKKEEIAIRVTGGRGGVGLSLATARGGIDVTLDAADALALSRELATAARHAGPDLPRPVTAIVGRARS